MASDSLGFARALAADSALSTTDIAVCVAWYLQKQNGSDAPIKISDVVTFIESHAVRATLNKSRLTSELLKRKDVSVSDRKSLKVKLNRQIELAEKYNDFLSEPPPAVIDSILQLEDWLRTRGYVQALARQVNMTFQFGAYDACAVMMRRLAEVLIIDAFEEKGARDIILENGNYKMLSGLIGALTSGQNFKLSRSAPKCLERLKELGDNAAHSRTYITKRIDIDEFKGSYRNLVAELYGLASS